MLADRIGAGVDLRPLAARAGRRVVGVRFVDHDAALIGTGPSGALHFWQTDTYAAIGEICSRRGDPLDAREWNRYLTGIPARQICP